MSRTSILLIVILFFAWDCGNSASPGPSSVYVALTPYIARVHINRSVQLSATVHNSTNTALIWSISGAGCSGAACGMISSAGLFTAPGSVPSPAQVTVRATSAADTSKSASTLIIILPAVVVTVSPPDPTIPVGWILGFTATVQNADDSRVIWTAAGPGCTGAECGTISTSGIYTAPSHVPALPTVLITATSVEDPVTSGSASALIAPSILAVEWAWVSGSNIVNARGEYGTQGTPAVSNVPGARQGPVSWTDPSGALWLFGGRGLLSNAIEGFLNDLWRFDPAANEWTWVSGSNSQDQYGSYGTQGVADPSNVPGARYDSVSWLDPGGNLWLFGGYGIYSALGGWGTGNDLWKYDPATQEWTWVSGSNTGEQAGTYGTKGLGNPSNVPGARRYAVSWLDSGGALWLFGGMGYGTDGVNAGMLNDLWRYDPSDGEWIWISGSDTINQPGVYGTKGAADPANIPGARFGAVSWLDLSGNLWLFGGGDPQYNHLNDLWKFDVTTHEWSWVSGNNSAGQAGVYGTKGLPDLSNVPGGRGLALSFLDPGGKFWLFGGAGYDSTGDNTVLNDLWMFDPATREWAWVSGSNIGFQLGTYGTKGVADPLNVPGARYYGAAWADALGNFWLFGGWGQDSGSGFMFLNDLWKGIR